MSKNSSRFERTISRFNDIHHEDPEKAVWGGSEIPKACLYHDRLSYWLEQLDPYASEPLQLAARCQHIRRWVISRSDYPEGLSGYRRWRSALMEFHANEASLILREAGYDDATISRVRDFLTKKDLKSDAETRLFEDAICLVFFETELAKFASQHERNRVIRVLRKVWKKMSTKGRETAQQLAAELPTQLQKLLAEAIFRTG